MISFVVPAHNEEACLGRTLKSIHESAKSVGQPYEILVVDDASTDATPEIAQRDGARVVPVSCRQIAGTRNAGARAARGEVIFFVDADTTANSQAVAAALRCLENGAVGGGAPSWVGVHEELPLYAWLIAPFSVIIPKLTGFTGGAFMFCTREAFAKTGGFNERLYWAEEIAFAMALKREGRFVVLWQRVTTSGRRFRKTSGLQLLFGGLRVAFSPRKALTHRSLVEKVWYDSNRQNDDEMPTSLRARISNGIAFLILLIVMTQPAWSSVPWSLTPFSSLLGKTRFTIGIVLSHVGLIFWPLGVGILWNLFRQKRPSGLIQSLVLAAFCLWEAWGASAGVIHTWMRVYHWLT